MEIKQTSRGFSIIEFTDYNGEVCNIQESSAIPDGEGYMIWIGCEEIGHKYLAPNEGWKDVEAPKPNSGEIANNRMHLSQEQVKQLLPILQKFAETGGL